MAHTDSSLNQISLEYAYAELQQATRNFDASLQLGSGSFGGVFRAVQRDGTEVAIKVLDVPEEAGFEEEVRVLSKFRHPNLVILMGFARNEAQRFLVYELLAGGDVYKRLQKSCLEGFPFPWRQRVSAAFDAACGLSHLHHASPKVFHRDIKSPNILLDRNGTAKMADFGLACLSHASSHKVKQASGTVGYACPLYVQRGVVTEGSEVYSFGIVLLEMLTASPPACMSQGPDGSTQYQFLVTHLGGDVRVAVQMADPKAHFPPQVSHSVGELAIRSTQMLEEMRPSFTEVVNTLRQLRDVPEAAPPQPQPQPPPSMHYSMVPGAAQHMGRSMVVGHGGHVVDPRGAPQPAAVAEPQVIMRPVGLQPQVAAAKAAAVAAAAAAAASCQPSASPPRMPQVASLGILGNHVSSQPLQQYVKPQPSVVAPALWTLECVRSEVVGGPSGLSKEHRRLVHRHERGGPLLPTLRVGRLFQDDLFGMLIPDEDTRGAISREHFQIWADEMPVADGGPSTAGGIPCHFFLTNYSVNGTIVNGTHLQTRGEQMALHSGDIIAFARLIASGDGYVLAPFLEFRFDLSGSILTDADAFEHGECPVTGKNAPVNSVGSRSYKPPRPPSPAPGRATATATPEWKPRHTIVTGASTPGAGAAVAIAAATAAAPVAAAMAQVAPSPRQLAAQSPPTPAVPFDAAAAAAAAGICGGGPCTSFIGKGLEPLFVLEAGGTAVREGLQAEHRRIVHGPPARAADAAEAEPCPPLLLGRAQQQVFWQRLLIDEAFNALSRQHLRIEVSEDVPQSGFSSFSVRNLSERNPIRVCSSLEDGAVERARPLERDERRALAHGDVIVVNPNRGNTLWLVFMDLMAGRGMSVVSCPVASSCYGSSATLPPPTSRGNGAKHIFEAGHGVFTEEDEEDAAAAAGLVTIMAGGAGARVQRIETMQQANLEADPCRAA